MEMDIFLPSDVVPARLKAPDIEDAITSFAVNDTPFTVAVIVPIEISGFVHFLIHPEALIVIAHTAAYNRAFFIQFFLLRYYY